MFELLLKNPFLGQSLCDALADRSTRPPGSKHVMMVMIFMMVRILKKPNMKYDKDPTYPSEIFVSELRSKSEWERFPPALSISSFQREYLKKKHI